MWITFDSASGKTMTRQLYEQIREQILAGKLTQGDKLPSTRRLSAELGIARNTVLEVYSQLLAEGYLEAAHGSATRVACHILYGLHPMVSEVRAVVEEDKAVPPVIDFRTGVPALELFPREEWARLYREVCKELPAEGYGYCGALGVPALRQALCSYLLRTKGIQCHPGQIMITTGATQGLSLLSHLLGEEDKTVLVEDPTHPGLRAVIATAGCKVQGVPVDEKGLLTKELQEKENVAFVYTTPSHQYPMGGILPIHRRLELIQFAREQDTLIVEDDYDSEFRYTGHPVSSLYELAPDRVVYLGSFSKTLSPALRLGYMMIPNRLIRSLKTRKVYADVHTDALSQYALAKFLESGGMERHI